MSSNENISALDEDLEIEITDLFRAHNPTLTLQRRFQGVGHLNRGLAARIRRLEETSPQRPLGTRQYRAGFSTAVDFLQTDDPDTRRLVLLLRDAVADYLKQSAKVGASLGIASFHLVGWGTLLRAHDWICPHSHDAGGLAGVYYLEIPPLEYPQGCLELFRPASYRSGLGRYDTSSDGRGPAETIRLMPEEGLLHLFPGDMMHLVYPFEGKGERLAIGLTITFEI